MYLLVMLVLKLPLLILLAVSLGSYYLFISPFYLKFEKVDFNKPGGDRQRGHPLKIKKPHRILQFLARTSATVKAASFKKEYPRQSVF